MSGTCPKPTCIFASVSRVIFVDGLCRTLFRLSLKAQHTMVENGAVQNEVGGSFE